MVNTDTLDGLIEQMREVAIDDYVLPEDNNVVRNALREISRLFRLID